jgi:hypothetical protein
MLNVLSVLCHDGRGKARKAFTQLREDLGSHEVLYRLFAAVIGVDVYVKLR